MEFDFLRFRRGNVPPGKVGKGESLAIWSWRQGEVQQAELGDPKAGGDTLLERLLFWVDWRLVTLYVLSSRRETSELPVTSLWPRLQLVLGYFLSQMAYPRKAVLLFYSETGARSSLNRHTSYAVWTHC